MSKNNFASLFRGSAPYIHAFRGKTFVIVISGECVQDNGFANLVHDIALLNSLGIRLALIHGARPQIDTLLKHNQLDSQFSGNLRITDEKILPIVKQAVGATRMDIEAMLSMGLPNSPMAGSNIKIVGGNFVIAKPYGIRDSVDFLHTGEVRRINGEMISKQLDNASMVLLSPLGYSPTGEIFNLSAEDVATSTAVALQADKLIYLTEPNLLGEKQQTRELTIEQTQQFLDSEKDIDDTTQRILNSAIQVCKKDVKRVHLINRQTDGALLQELFTRDGIGTLISADLYEGTRCASIEDVSGILELITPLEEKGIMVRRSRELLEMEIDKFTIIERDGMIIGCAALYTFEDSPQDAELACLAVHPDYQGSGRGDTLLSYIEKVALQKNIQQLFILTTHSTHWFQERGFSQANLDSLPVQRQIMYNYQRKSVVFCKKI